MKIVMIHSLLGAPLPLRAGESEWRLKSGEAAAAQQLSGPGNVSIFLPLYKVQCFTKDEIHI